MFNSNTGFSMPVVPAYGGNGGMGGFGDSWIGLIIVLALLFGDGNGFGGLGGFGGGKQNCATPADLTANSIVQKLDGITYGISDSTFALSNSINNGFHGVDNAICTLGYQNQQCCCETQRLIERGFADTNYNMATQACDTRNLIQNTTRDIIDNANANNRALLDFLVNDKISTLQAENQALKFKASQSEQNALFAANQQAQTAELIRRLDPNPCPTAAYIVQPPTPVTFPVNCCGQFSGYGYNSCGCGCA